MFFFFFCRIPVVGGGGGGGGIRPCMSVFKVYITYHKSPIRIPGWLIFFKYI